MALQKIGLEAVLDLRKWNRAFRQYTRDLDKMNRKTSRTARNLTDSFVGFGNSLLKVAAILSGALVVGAGLAAVALGKLTVDSIQKAAELEQGLANIAAVLNMTKDEAEFFKDVIIDLGLDPQLQVTTFEAAEVMEILAKNGIFAGQSMQEMEETARGAAKAAVLLANATGAQFGQAADIATDAMILFNLEADDMVDIVSSVTSVTTNSKFTIDDYELALRNGGAAAAAMGVSLQDFNVAVAASAEELGKGRKAGTGMLNFINRLTPNSKKATGVMEDLGLIVNGNNQFFDDATGELKSFDEISKLLNESLFGTQAIITEVGGRTQEQNEILSQLNSEYEKAEQTIFDYTQGAKSLTASEDEKNAALEQAFGTIDAITPRMEELNSITGDLVVTNSHLTDEQRSVALETIFGNDGMRTAIALAKEGAIANTTAAEVMELFGVNMHEANAMIADGITEWELLNAQMRQTDAVENAETRMSTLQGRMEILGGVIEAIQIKIGDAFIPLLTDVANKILDWVDANPELIDQIGEIAEKVAGLVEALINGQDPIQSLVQFFQDVGQEDIATKIENAVTAFENFFTPIVEFVSENSEAFIAALKAIGVALGGFMILAVIAGLLNLILNPITLIIVAVGLLAAAWETNFLGIQDVTEQVFDALQPLFEDAAEAIGNFIEFLQGDTASSQFEEVFAGIQEAIEIAQAVLEPFIEIIRDSLVSSFEQAAGSMDEFAPVLERLQELWILLQPAIQAVAQVLGGLLVANLGVIVGLFKGIEFSIQTFITTLAMTLEGVLQFVIGLEQLFTGIGDFIVGWITGNEQVMNEGWERIKEGATNIVLGMVQAITAALFGLGLTIFEFLAGFVTGFVQFFQDIFDRLVGNSIIPDLVNAVIEWMITLTTTVLETLAAFVAEMILKFVDTTKAIVDIIIKWVKDLIAKYIELRTKVIEQVNRWWNKLKEIIVQKIAEVIELITGFVNDAVQIVIDAKERFKSAGSSIIDGLISGISSKLADAQAAIMGVADGVKGAWDNFWGSQSPSRLMIESGQDIMAGVDIGADKSLSAVSDTFVNAGQVALGSFVGGATQLLPNTPVPQTINNQQTQTTQNFNVNNSFAGNPQITDADQLRLTLSGFSA